jgi:hypothetical protein
MSSYLTEVAIDKQIATIPSENKTSVLWSWHC